MIGGMATRTGTPQSHQQVTAAAHDATTELLGDPVLGGGYDRIVHSIFRVDPLADYATVELSLEPKGNDPAILIDALDKSETAARCAHRLLVNAQLAYEEAKLEVARIESPLREGARKHLEAQKETTPGDEADKGKPTARRTKTITNDDVESAMAQLYPADITACRRRLIKAKGTVEHLERLADLVKMRIRTLDTLVSAARR